MGSTATIAISPALAIGDAVTGNNVSKGIDSLLGTNKKPRASSAPLTKPGMTQDEIEREARVEAAKRRKQFEDVGKSSTILTGPGGLSGSGAGTPKTLLGY